MGELRAAGRDSSPFRPISARAAGNDEGDVMRKIISGLFHGSKPALVVAALVAVVGVTGTAYAGKHPGSDSKGDAKQGQTWSKSSKGDKGNKDPKWGNWGHSKGGRTAYGVATVNVSRGGAAAVAWATYSTALGSPVGDTTGGVFRFTCSTANAPCTVSVAAAILSRSAGDGAVYPRVLIYRQDYNAGGPEVYCEYGDGSIGSAPLAIANQPFSSTPTYTPVPINIGGSADCGGPITTAGDVSVITVPSGYYDVHSTFVFAPEA
jgi:hypothetical protein